MPSTKYHIPKPPLKKKKNHAITAFTLLLSISFASTSTPYITWSTAKNIGNIYAKRRLLPHKYILEEFVSHKNG